MSQKSLDEYLARLRGRYQRCTTRKGRGRILDEFCEVTELERKYASKVLSGRRRCRAGQAGKRGRARIYGPAEAEALVPLWLAMEQPCGKRLHDMLALWLPHAEGLDPAVTRRLLEASPATLDRLLAPARATRGRRRPKAPRSTEAIKAAVPIRAEKWEKDQVGYTEVDTVAHCGGDMGGDFIWSVTSTEIVSGWTEVRAQWNRGQHATFESLEDIEKAQPFALLGIDSDGGGEFLNFHLHTHLKGRGIDQTRSRPYRKNDQAHVEQKNDTHVRQLLGYERLGQRQLVEPLNELLRAWSLWKNLWCTTLEQISCERVGQKQVRRHARTTKTPAQRLLASSQVSAENKERIQSLLAAESPFVLKARIEALHQSVWQRQRELENQDSGKTETPPRNCAAGASGSTLRSEPEAPARSPNHPESNTRMVSAF